MQTKHNTEASPRHPPIAPERITSARGVDLLALAGRHTTLKRHGRLWMGRCPFHDDRDPSFQVNPELGHWRCWAGCGHGDAIDLLRKLDGLSWPDAVRRLSEGATEPARTQKRAQATEVQERARRAFPALLRTFARARPLPGTVGEAYLAGRGCPLPHPDGDLRFLPAHRHPFSGYVGPALVALVTDAVTAQPVSLHQTWLRPDGSGKAELAQPRMIWGGTSIAGGVVRLWPDAEITFGLAIGEGIESALSVAGGFGLAWACINAGNVAAFPVLEGVESLLIGADNDPAGLGAAKEARDRWRGAGREAFLWHPPTPGHDPNDHARQRGDTA